MVIRVFDILYCITEEDVQNTETDVAGVAADLPSVLILDVDSEDDIADAISDKTGWLVEGFDFEIVG